MRLRLLFLKEDIKSFVKMIKAIPSLCRFYKDYEYNGDDVAFIIENYEQVLCNRTKLMSKPTYHWREVINQIDEWYEED